MDAEAVITPMVLRRRRHRITENVRGIVHRGGVIGRAALADDFHRDVIRDDGVVASGVRLARFVHSKLPAPEPLLVMVEETNLIIRAAERVFERQIIDDRVADVLDGDAENDIAADGHRRVGGTQQNFRDVQRRVVDQQR